MFECLEEGILVVKDKSICYKNKIFDKVFSQIPILGNILELASFTIYKHNNDENDQNDNT